MDANALFQYSETGYADTLTDNEGTRKVRTNDGIHFTLKGQRLLTHAILSKLGVSETHKLRTQLTFYEAHSRK